jgi:D-alanyl-D-alanine carboxypeptidase (penicillin-binding protein 5/6)
MRLPTHDFLFERIHYCPIMTKILATILALIQFQVPIAAHQSFSEASLLQVSSPFHRNEENIAPIVKANAAIVVDMKTNDILYAKDIYDRLPIASLTKLMTALVITDELSPDQIVEVNGEVYTYNGNRSVKVGLRNGDRMDIYNLLHASLIRSANDASAALAVAGAGSIEAFVEKMNERSTTLSLKDTHFANPVGFDHPDNYSTAFDLSLIAKQAFRRPLIREIMTKEAFTLRDADGRERGVFSNTNHLLGSYLEVLGGKTGTTPEAGQCLFFVVKNEQGHEILIILLNSPNRYQEAKVITDWIFRTYTWAKPK